MAQGSNEHRMVFDIRGRRRHVVKVVYAILALLMVASLFLVTGAINLNSIFGGNTGGESAVSSIETQVENIEAKLAKNPGDESVLGNLTRTQLSLATAMISGGAFESRGGAEEVLQQYSRASESWSEYVKAAGEPHPSVAGAAAPGFFEQANLSVELTQKVSKGLESIKLAVEAQESLAKAEPSLGTYSTLAFYQMFAQEFKAAEESKEKAIGYTNSKFERESFENKYEEVEKNAKQFGEELKAEKSAKSETAGKEALQYPLQQLGGTSSPTE